MYWRLKYLAASVAAVLVLGAMLPTSLVAVLVRAELPTQPLTHVPTEAHAPAIDGKLRPRLRSEIRPEPKAMPGPSAVGLPLHTADGKLIGTVVATGHDEDNEPVLLAEVEQPLGLGPAAVAVPMSMFVHRGNRIELTLTEAEVHAKLGR